MSCELEPGIYDPLSGNTSRKCQNPKCDVVFQGHANRRYCGEQCKRNMEVSRRPARIAKRNYVHPRARVYSNNVTILEQIMAKSEDQNKVSISVKKLLASGFDENSPSDQLSNPNFVFHYDKIWRFDMFILCYHGSTQSYTVLKGGRKMLFYIRK